MSRFPLSRLAPLALVWLLPTDALAYYPCNGPGPGEVLIGVDPGGNGIAPTPLAWGTDQSGGPTYSWYSNAASQAEADAGALTQCQASGFLDCRIAMGVTNGAIAVAVDTGGALHTDWGKDARQAKKKALRFCRKQGGKGCKIEQVLESPAAWISN
jgi:hypothetical protein